VSTAYLDEAEQCDDLVLLHEGSVLSHQPPEAFHAPSEGHVFLVQYPKQHKRTLQEALHVRPGVVDALVQADGVRVVLQGKEPLQRDGEQWQAAAPRFEDAFVSLLRSGQTEPAAPRSASHTQARSTTPAAPEGAPSAVIEVKELRRYFGAFQAVRGISFSVRKGEIFGLLGANGAGKSTTFRMLCGLLPASSGTLRVAGADLRTANADARTRIGYVAQKFALYGNLSARQNLNFFASAYGLTGARRTQRLDWAFAEFDLAEYADAGATELPLGYKQRLALACALMHEPSILFLDEPTSGVDPLARRAFWQRINQLAESGVTIMITTHFMDEAEYCDHLVLMSLGEILAFGTPREIRGRARTDALPDPTMEDAFIALIQSHEAQIRRAA
ncbi:MAG: ATP-binding cassette domain-containing protein, partial [Thiomonas sp.]